ncbi:MAG: hypothetical protein ACI87N_001491 [Flavobacteriales bacterium]|jgi:uncharacterized protein (DUF983 family)
MNIVSSVINYYCPKCRGQKMFKEPLNIMNPLDMHESCSVCKEDFEPEPGFYFGAMFLSYIMSGFSYLFIALGLVFGFDWGVNGAMATVLLFAVVTFIPLMRLSRSLWIHIIVGYDKQHEKKTTA